MCLIDHMNPNLCLSSCLWGTLPKVHGHHWPGLCHQLRIDRGVSSIHFSNASPFSFLPLTFFFPFFAISSVYPSIYPSIHPSCPSVHLSIRPETDLQTLLCGGNISIQILPRWPLGTNYLLETAPPFCSSRGWVRLGNRRMAATASGWEHPSISGNCLCGSSTTRFKYVLRHFMSLFSWVTGRSRRGSVFHL